MGAVVAMVDVAASSAGMIMVFTDNGGVAVVPVTFFDTDADALDLAEVRTGEIISRVRRLFCL